MICISEARWSVYFVSLYILSALYIVYMYINLTEGLWPIPSQNIGNLRVQGSVSINAPYAFLPRFVVVWKEKVALWPKSSGLQGSYIYIQKMISRYCPKVLKYLCHCLFLTCTYDVLCPFTPICMHGSTLFEYIFVIM